MRVYKKPLVIFFVLLTVSVITVIVLRSIWNTEPKMQKMDAADSFNAGNLDDAIKAAEDTVSADSQNIEALLLLATSYAEKGNQAFDEVSYGQRAIDTANRALAIDPKNSQAYNVIGYAYEIMEKYDDARLNYDKAIGLNPDNAQAYSNKGHSYDLQGDSEKASELYDKALSIDPNNEHALLNSARISMRKNDNKSAEAGLILLTETGRNARIKAAAYQLLAFIESRSDTGTLERAVSLLNKALELDPSMPQAYTLLADLYITHLPYTANDAERKSDVSNAKDALNKALAINPSSASAYYHLSQIAITEGDMKMYNEYKQKALDVLPDDITLGANERASLKEVLDVTITNIKVDPK